MVLKSGCPPRGDMLQKLKFFLKRCGLDYDERISFWALMLDDDEEIIASGGLDGAILKCIAVAPEHQGEDLSAQIVTALRKEAFERGHAKLMLYTKPRNERMFASLGFYPLTRTAECLLMENQRNGLADFLKDTRLAQAQGTIGCIVAHCNPFTLGHLHLVEAAARACDWVYLFILSEAGGRFSPEQRLEMARLGCAALKNVIVRESGPYMVSSATFPTYFLPDKSRADEVFCELDVRLFGERIAPALNISRRFVGSEPICPVTRQYNFALQAGLPRYGVSVTELERYAISGAPVSASRVRALLDAGRLEEIRPLVPASTYAYLTSDAARS